MLNAVLHSKVRHKFDELEVSADWRQVYRQNEDFLSATVFTRLTYLTDSTFRRVLLNAISPKDEVRKLFEDAGSLRAVRFWRNYSYFATGGASSRREPDLVLEFENLLTIVEAKLDTNVQRAVQWAEQISAIFQSDAARGRSICLVAVGGMSRVPQEIQLPELRAEAQQLLEETIGHGYPATYAACSWHQLSEAVREALRAEREPNEVRILGDIQAALEFYSVLPSTWLASLPATNIRYADFERSLASLANWDGKKASAVGLAGLRKAASRLGGISSESQTPFRRE